jgi:predicted RND superfamily exporter protein
MGKWAADTVRRLTIAIHRSPYLFLLASVLVTAGMALAAGRIALKSNMEDLLPANAPSVKAMQVLRERLGSADSMVVTLMTDDFKAVIAALPEIASAIAAHPDIREVRYRQDVALIERNALVIFPTLPELEQYYTDLTETIKRAVSKRLDLFGEADPEDTDATAPHGASDGGRAPGIDGRTSFAWGELEQDTALADLGRRFREERGRYREYFYNTQGTTIGLQIFPRQPSSNVDFSRRILADVDRIVASVVASRLGAVGPGEVVERVDVGGSYRTIVDETDAIKGDVWGSIAGSVALLAVLLILAFRSLRVFFCVMVPLLMGSIWTAGLVGLTIGYLNMITAFIFAVLLGLGIDFGIHYYGRFREEMAAGHGPLDAMIITQVSSGEAVLNAQLTTSLAFFALALADFRGFSQFGVVAGAGVILCHLAVVVVLPAVAFIFERWFPLRLLGFTVERDETGAIRRGRFPLHGPFGLTLTAALLLAIVVTPAWLAFEYDFRNTSTVKKVNDNFEAIQHGTTQATAPAVIFAGSEAEARAYQEQLEARVDADVAGKGRIKSFQSLYSLIPTQQAEKRAVVERICRKLRRKVGVFEGDERDGALELLSHCDPTEVTLADLPDWVRAQFSDKTGRVGEFIFVSPRGSVNDGLVALGFREEMLSLKGPDGAPPMVSGKPMVWAEVLIQMKADGQVITLAALAAVLGVLFWFERSVATVLLILVPLFTAFGLVQIVMVLAGIKLNFFNIVAAPTLIGLGVDGGTHIYHRYKELGPGSIPYILRNTGWSSFLVALTASMGYVSLLGAEHRGIKSLGVLTLIAIAANLFTTFVLLPAILQWREDRRARRDAARSN